MPGRATFATAPYALRGVTVTLACLWLTLPARADALPRLLPESALSAPMLAEAGPPASPTLAVTAAAVMSRDGDSERGDSKQWVRAKLVRQWGMMMLIEAIAFTGLLAAEAIGRNDGYPFQEDHYGCGGRAAPIATAAIGAVGLALTIKGSFGMRRHVGARPVRFGPERRPIRRWSPLLAAGAIAVAGTLVGAAFHDLFCNS